MLYWGGVYFSYGSITIASVYPAKHWWWKQSRVSSLVNATSLSVRCRVRTISLKSEDSEKHCRCYRFSEGYISEGVHLYKKWRCTCFEHSVSWSQSSAWDRSIQLTRRFHCGYTVYQYAHSFSVHFFLNWITNYWPLSNNLPLVKMAAISQKIFSYAFSWMKSLVFWSEFHWSMFLNQINNDRALVYIMAWRRIGCKPLS